jgi:Tol biopolymer transport system component
MREPSPSTLPPAGTSEDRLDSWKEIAAYLNRDVTTVQRWEKREGMPVHRHLHDKMGSVYASRAELDAWTRGRNLRAVQDAVQDNAAPVTTLPHAPSPPTAATPLRSRSKRKSILLLVAVGSVLAIAVSIWFQRTDYFWRNPMEGARFQTITDFDGVARDAALSSDGHFVAFLSDHDGPMDVWVSQVGSREFHNLTHGGATELFNPSLRTLGFSPDGAFVTFWVRKPKGSTSGDISVWAAPTLGGQPRPYLEGVAEFDWTRDGSRLAYHTPGPGDPLFVSDSISHLGGKSIFTAPSGLHAHFPLWSPDNAFIYFVQGSIPDRLAVFRIAPTGGAAERITPWLSHVAYPVLLDRRTLLYLANEPDGSGPWLYGMDVARRKPHRLTSGPERYTSLAASADGRRLAVTLATPKRTLWHLRVDDPAVETPLPAQISLTTSSGFSPRLGPGYLLYISTGGASDGVWKLVNGTGTELWSGQDARVFGGPAISSDGRHIAFSVLQHGQKVLYVMDADGTNVRVVADSLDLEGAPAWSNDGNSITSAVNDHGLPRLFRLSVERGAPVPFVKEYSLDPVWAPDGRFAVYSGADIGTTFSIKAVEPDGTDHPIPAVTLTRGARKVVFAPGGRSLILLRGGIQHKDLWMVDLQTGAERQLTRVPADFDIREFDLSSDGREVVLERLQERSDILLANLARH